MRFDPNLKLKWLEASAPAARGIEFKVSNHCAFWVSDREGGLASAICVFDPRDLTPEVLDRIGQRVKRSGGSTYFKLLIPEFIQHRLSSVSSQLEEFRIDVVVSPFLHVKFDGGFFHTRTQIRVVNVDDSNVILRLLKHMLSDIPYIDLIGQISDSKVAARRIFEMNPDAVTMDIQMPDKTGVEVVREVMTKQYIPIIMVSSVSMEEGTLVFSALREGAFEYLQKPKAEDKTEFLEALKDKLVAAASSTKPNNSIVRSSPRAGVISFDRSTLWCLGSSTGGTQALTEVFRGLPSHIPPTVVVQHIPPIFSKSFADSVNELCPFQIKEAQDGEALQPDTIYIAPGGMQMAVCDAPSSSSVGLRISISDAPPVNRFKPSVDFLFDSVAKLKSRRVVAGILTGMGKDGAQGLLKLKEHGAYTFAQDEATCTVYGMPRAAFEIGATMKVCPLGEVADVLMGSSNHFKKSG